MHVPGRILLDMGQNLSGYPEIRVRGQKGQKIKLWVGELTKGDTLVNQSQSGSPHYYEYTLKGGGDESWRPRFSYYGFQYIQVEGANYNGCPQQEGLPQLLDVKSCFLQSSATRYGTFSSATICSMRYTRSSTMLCAATCSRCSPIARTAKSWAG
jgi:alpha-L-rhamnosidase